MRAGPAYGGSFFPKDTKEIISTADKFKTNLSVIKSVIKSNENRSKLFYNVPQFVNLFGSDNNLSNQNLLFEEEEISFDDKNLFDQKLPVWSSGEKLKNELEVVGFYFSDHPLKHYPKKFFEIQNIDYFNDVVADDSVKKLRSTTGAGFKDCNSALKEASGDLDKACL